MNGSEYSSWPTPMAGTPAQNGNSAAGNSDFSRKAEDLAERLWMTPAPMQTREGWTTEQLEAARQKVKETAKNGNGFGINLAAQAATWPTASAMDWKGSAPNSITRRDGKSRMDMLDFAAEQGFHHPHQTTMPRGVPSCEWRPISRRLLRSAISSVEPTTLRRWLRKGAWRKRRLNPIFVA